MNHVQIGLDMAAFVIAQELYLASLQPQDTIVVICGAESDVIMKLAVDVLECIPTTNDQLNDQGVKCVRLNRALLIANVSESDKLFRGRTVSSIFVLPDYGKLPESAKVSLTTSKNVGLGRVYDILDEVVSLNPNEVSKHRYLQFIR